VALDALEKEVIVIREDFKKLIPALTGEEYKQLEANILSEGIRDPLVVWNGYLVDGHNRYAIANKYSLEFRTVNKEFKDGNEAKLWMINNQFGRRNLNSYQRSVLALELESIFSLKAKANLVLSGENFGKGPQISANPIIEPIETRQEVAKVANVSHDTIAKVKKIEAIATPEVKAQLSTGVISINQAYQEIKKEEKAIFLVERKQREIEEATEVKPESKLYNVQFGQVWKLGRHTLTCGNAYDSIGKEATAIITDPPYGIDYQADWKKWDGSESDFKKVEGDLQEFDPRPFLNYPTVLLFGANYFTSHLPRGGWLCWDKRLKDELDDMVGSPFELAWFKSSATKKSSIMVRVLHGGVVNADSTQGNNQKRYHPTQKPVVLMEEILKKITREREIICDPFCGSGTTLIAAENTGRTCIAYEIDPLYCNIILSRYEKLTSEQPCLV
jgi:hypothetical protein